MTTTHNNYSLIIDTLYFYGSNQCTVHANQLSHFPSFVYSDVRDQFSLSSQAALNLSMKLIRLIPRSVDIDIVTNSPTLQGQSVIQQPQAAPNSPWQFPVQSGASPQQNGMVQQNGYSAATQTASIAPTSAGEQNAAKQPIQIDSQTVGRVVGVAGTALILGAFLKNGGVGGMMNTFGLDNRFHSRGSSLAPY